MRRDRAGAYSVPTKTNADAAVGTSDSRVKVGGTKMARSVRVVLLDEYELIRQGVRLILEQVPTIRVVGEARNVKEALEVTAFVRPDLIVADVASPDEIRQLKRQNPTVRVIVLSAN